MVRQPVICFLFVCAMINQAQASIALKVGNWSRGKNIVVQVDGAEEDLPCLEQTTTHFSDNINIGFSFHLKGSANAPRKVDVKLKVNRETANGVGGRAMPLNIPLMSERVMVVLAVPGVCDYLDQHIILHEFGHVLGLMHEHQHPNTPDEVIADIRSMFPEANQSQIRRFNFVERLAMRIGEYDPESVMHYGVERTDLSEGDLQMLKRIYGERVSSEEGPAEETEVEVAPLE